MTNEEKIKHLRIYGDDHLLTADDILESLIYIHELEKKIEKLSIDVSNGYAVAGLFKALRGER